MERETGGPAFPVGDVVERDEKGHLHGPVISSVGMTMLDYFAAKAMQGYLANSWQAETLDSTGESSSEQMAIVAEISYLMADAMLKARAISKATGE